MGDTLSAHLISEIVAHLTIRVEYFWDFIDAAALELFLSMDTLIHRPTELFESIELPKHRTSSKFEKMAMDKFEKHQFSLITNLTPKAVVRLLYQAIQEDLLLLQKAASSEFSTFSERLKG